MKLVRPGSMATLAATRPGPSATKVLGDPELENQRAEGGPRGGEGVRTSCQGLRGRVGGTATPTSFSLFTAYSVFLITARYTQPKPPSPIFSLSEKLWVPWEISLRGQQNGEGWAPCRSDAGLSALGCGRRWRSRRGPLCPSPESHKRPLPSCLLAGPPELPGVPSSIFLLVLTVPWGWDPLTLVEEGAGRGGGGCRMPGLWTGPSSAPEWVWEPGKASQTHQ